MNLLLSKVGNTLLKLNLRFIGLFPWMLMGVATDYSHSETNSIISFSFKKYLVQMVAFVIACLVSAISHEFWAFIGIMVQVPLVLFTNYLQDKFRDSMVL